MKEMIQIDPDMDMTKDMDYRLGSRGITYFFTNTNSIPKDFFSKHVKNKSFLDLGAGDGRIVRLARECGAKFFRGIEIDHAFIRGPLQRYIKCDNMLNAPINRYDVIFYYLHSDIPAEVDLLKKIEREFVGKIIVYYRKVEHHLEDFTKAIELCGFERVDDAENMRVFQKKKEEA